MIFLLIVSIHTLSLSSLGILNKYLSLEYHFSNNFNMGQDKCNLEW